MKETTARADLVAFCGLYCGACRSCLRGRCPGTHMAEHGLQSLPRRR